MENATEQRCHFYSAAQKFVCRVKVPPGTDDTKALVVSVCVSSRAGSAAAEDRIFTLNGIRECPAPGPPKLRARGALIPKPPRADP